MYQQAPEKPLRMHGTPYQIQKARELVSGILTQQEVRMYYVGAEYVDTISQLYSLYSRYHIIETHK